MSNSSIWPIDRKISCATTPGQRRPVSDGNKGALHIHQSFCIIWDSQSDCLMPYHRHSLECGSYPSAGMHAAYSTAPADMAVYIKWCRYTIYTVAINNVWL